MNILRQITVTVLCITMLMIVPSRAGSPAFKIQAALWFLSPSMATWQLGQFDCWIQDQVSDGKNTLWLVGTDQVLAQPGGDTAITNILTEADNRGLRVIVDIANDPTQWTEINIGKSVTAGVNFINQFLAMYSGHRCLYAWYINQETYMTFPGTPQDTFVRAVWSQLATYCKQVSPQMLVSISPFFLLDSQSVRGFRYAQPKEYTDYWISIFQSAPIDILMLQDSGEHLSFFTINDRLPFWNAVKQACTVMGRQFWLNIEAGQCNISGWAEYQSELQAGRDPLADPRRWSKVSDAFFQQKCNAAAGYATKGVSWGWFEFQHPTDCPPSQWLPQ